MKFFQNKFKNLDGPAFDTLDGKNHKARFGLSVACAGNINLDGITSETPKGIQDLVIGAPYDGEDHTGAIYIYLGTPNGISQTHAQVLYLCNILFLQAFFHLLRSLLAGKPI